MVIRAFGHSEAAPPYLQDEITNLEEYLNEHFEELEEGNKGRYRNCNKKNCCALEFFYYYSNGGGWRNAIWVRVNGRSTLWLYLHINSGGRKKVCIYSDTDLMFHQYPQMISTKRLPEDALLPSVFNGPFAFHERIIANINIDLINEMMTRLPFVCSV